MTFDGLVMDVDRLASSITAKDNTATDRLNFMSASGNRASAMAYLQLKQLGWLRRKGRKFGLSIQITWELLWLRLITLWKSNLRFEIRFELEKLQLFTKSQCSM